ncbi:hypothetical protein A0H81_12625 [Grifola frondosa]|uniref:Uncharacterized protein n=1 Tax=Grifola frondosa TaxID=5627 RepID=A0A1C7LS13_GRIFR|nr:hypothetical protein A0H81_12625 [Grifola frondosa]
MTIHILTFTSIFVLLFYPAPTRPSLPWPPPGRVLPPLPHLRLRTPTEATLRRLQAALPLDPFASTAGPLGDPWFLKVDALLACANHQRRDVILILGAPSLTDLSPVLQSRHLALSLVILATHAPQIFPTSIPAQSASSTSSNGLSASPAPGASTAGPASKTSQRITTCTTSSLPLSHPLPQLPQHPAVSTLLRPPAPCRLALILSIISSHLHLPPLPLHKIPPPSIRPHATPLRRTPQLPPIRRPRQVPPQAQHPRHHHLASLPREHRPPQSRTRSASASSMCPSSPRPSRPLSIFSSIGALGRSASSVYLPPASACGSGDSLYNSPAPPRKALLVHLLTPHHNAHPTRTRAWCAASRHSSCRSRSPTLTPSAHPHGDGPDGLARARPYVMSAGTFSGAVTCEPGVADQWGEWTVADLVLCGALDADGAPRPGKAPRRAWVGGATDVVVLPAADEFGVEKAGEGGATLRVPPDVLNGLPTPPYSDESSEGGMGRARVAGGWGTKRKIQLEVLEAEEERCAARRDYGAVSGGGVSVGRWSACGAWTLDSELDLCARARTGCRMRASSLRVYLSLSASVSFSRDVASCHTHLMIWSGLGFVHICALIPRLGLGSRPGPARPPAPCNAPAPPELFPRKKGEAVLWL